MLLGIGIALLAIGTRRGDGGLLRSPVFVGTVLFAAGALMATSGAQAFSGSLASDAAGVEMTGAGVYVAGAVLLIIGLGLLILAGISFVHAIEGPNDL